MANCNYSLCTVNHVGDTFQNMFPDSKIAPNFTLSRTSVSYKISEGLAPYFKKSTLDDLVKLDQPLSMHFDETKPMDLTLHYWSPTQSKLSVNTALFIRHADGDKVAAKMFDQMAEDGLPMNRLVILV